MGSWRPWLKMLALAWVAGAGLIVIGGAAGAAYWFVYLDKGPPEVFVKASGARWFQVGLDRHYSDRFEEAIDAFERSIEAGYKPGVSAYNIACGYARMGERDAAFEWLDRARDHGFDLDEYLESDSDLASLHGDPRFEHLRHHAGLHQVPVRVLTQRWPSTPVIHVTVPALPAPPPTLRTH